MQAQERGRGWSVPCPSCLQGRVRLAAGGPGLSEHHKPGAVDRNLSAGLGGAPGEHRPHKRAVHNMGAKLHLELLCHLGSFRDEPHAC